MDGVRTLSAAVNSLSKRAPGIDRRKVEEAITYARDVYGDRRHEAFLTMTTFEHALLTAEFLSEFCHDEDAIIAAILQHSLERPGSSVDEIGRRFGRPIRDIVSRVHLLSHLFSADWRRSVDDMKIMLVSVSDDIRVLLIVLSIAASLLERKDTMRPERKLRVCRLALQLFAPVAARLGIYALKYRLERFAFPECYPVDSEHIGVQLKIFKDEHGTFLDRTAQSIRTFLAKEGIQADVLAREKQPYSIFQKMHRKSISSLLKVADLFAIRVVVPVLPDCYQTLGLLHRMGTALSHRFKDYISFPKPNGYQSLHTCLLGLPHAPKDLAIEVQIRTPEMNQEAEYGVAAHWLYKEHGKRSSVLKGAEHMRLSDVLMRQQSISDDETQLDASRLVDHIYVLTPRGDIIELPEGGTPLDFAFVVHTDLGLRFKSAKVNGSIVPLSYKLQNGDSVEIATHKVPRPTLQWLEEIVTPSGRSKLKAYFASHNRSQFLIRGKEMLNAELRARKLASLDNDLSVLSTFDGEALPLKGREDLLVKIGMGSVRTSSVLRHVLETMPLKEVKTLKKDRKISVSQKPVLGIDGEDHRMTLPHRYAKCCSPDTLTPRPESLIGVINRLGFVVVHKEGCKMARSVNPERRLRMHWR